jgi:glycyl-tRNA synthetase
VLSAAYTEETITKEDGSTDQRVVLRIPPQLAPVKVAVLPLVKKDGLPELARKIINELKFDFNCQYDEKDSIGKRYRRHDAIGTPFCITVDHQSVEDQTVTLRYRDSMKQDRVAIEKLPELFEELLSFKKLLKKL